MKSSLRIISSEKASINTATVEIKSLTVSGKQVTLAVFRQLIEEQIVDLNDMRLKGTPWGHVRYLVEYGSDYALNVVWQDGNELRRCLVTRRYPKQHAFNTKCDFSTVSSSTKDGEFLKISCDWGEINPLIIKKMKIQKHDIKYPEAGYDGSRFLPPRPREDNYEEKLVAYIKAEDEYGLKLKQQQENIDKRISAYKQECYATIQKWKEEHEVKIVAYEKLVTPLWSLPQLFIAV